LFEIIPINKKRSRFNNRLLNFDGFVKRQLLSFRAESKNSVTALFAISFDYTQDDIFRSETYFTKPSNLPNENKIP